MNCRTQEWKNPGLLDSSLVSKVVIFPVNVTYILYIYPTSGTYISPTYDDEKFILPKTLAHLPMGTYFHTGRVAGPIIIHITLQQSPSADLKPRERTIWS